MKTLLRIAITLMIPAALLCWAYSPDTYFRNFDFPASITFSSYLLIYAVIVFVSIFVAPLVTRRVGRSSSIRALVQAAVSALAFAALALLFGPTGLDIPGMRVRGIFFAEWKFVTFFFYVGLPVALAAGTTAFLKRDSTQG